MPHPHLELQERKALLHIDADAFFASCEQMIHPAWKGLPVVTGIERKIVAAASYEAKKLGIRRGVALWDAMKLAPNGIFVPSDYETYSLVSKRMYDIMKQWTPEVEEYSIDEAFLDITGMRRLYHKSYPQIAFEIKKQIESELGITVSVGLSSSKTLCKIASKWDKPAGFTIIGFREREAFLKDVPVAEIWGVGHASATFLNKYGIQSAWQFAQKDEEWVRSHFTKPHIQCWEELNGRSVIQLETKEKESYQTIGKTKTFSPPSSDPTYVFAQLSKNIENAFIKARRYKLGSKKMFLHLRKNDYTYDGIELKLDRPTCFPTEVMPHVQKLFSKFFHEGVLYRATGAVLLDVESYEKNQLSIFDSVPKILKQERIFGAVDKLAERYGKHAIFLGTSLAVHMTPDDRMRTRSVKGGVSKKVRIRETRKFIDLPLLDIELKP